MRLKAAVSCSFVLLCLSSGACSGARSTELDDAPFGSSVLPAQPGAEDPAAPAEPADGSGEGNGGEGGGKGKGSGNGGGNVPCAFKDSKDHDGDGLSFAQGDCNDCNPKVRPGLVDVAGTGLDEDCSGKADDEDAACDASLALASTSAEDAAKAIGLCTKTTTSAAGWGVVEARWTKPDGTPIASPLSWGLLPKLGSLAAPSGSTMLAISTGTARGPGDPGFQATSGHDKGYTHAAPPGQPKASSACAGAAGPGAPHDGVALELKIRVPSDAKSLSFTHQLFTSDYGEYVCTQYTDGFVAMMEPKPAGTDGNIIVDAAGNPLSANSTSLLRACAPGTHGGLAFTCPLGVASLAGTGFDDKAATGWLRTTVAVKGGSVITLRFAIWDSGDGILDSTALIDELAFSPVAAGAGAPQTVPR